MILILFRPLQVSRLSAYKPLIQILRKAATLPVCIFNSLVLTPEVMANTVRAYVENLVGCIPHLNFAL